MVEFIIKYRSFTGIICLVILLVLSNPSPVSISVGFVFIILGVFFRGWAAGYINKDKELATEGPYAMTRNPLYFGNMVIGIGIALAGNNLSSYLIFAAYYLFFFTFLVIVERKRMKRRFGEAYEQWAKRSSLFFPRLKRIPLGNFNISYYFQNKEYRVIFFSLVVVLVFILKWLYRLFYR